MRSAMPSRASGSARESFGGIFDFDAKATRLATLDRELEDPTIWDNPARAQELGREKKLLDGVVHTLRDLQKEIDDSSELYALARAESDDDTLLAVEADAGKLERGVADLEFRRMFHNPLDPGNAFVDIQAGSGGTEAQDWAAMLLRMFLRYCER
jgi:peptide chain release factor 2